MWRKAILKEGMHFGVTTHLAWSYSWFGVNKLADTEGPLKGVPYDGNDPAYEELYHDPNSEIGFYPINPTAKWRYEWACRIMDLIDKYKPDLLYFDGGLPFNGVDKSRTGMDVVAYYYNRSIAWHDGNLEGVFTLKKGLDGIYADGVGTLDFERGVSETALPDPWQCDDSIGPWSYDKRVTKYKTIKELIYKMVDIVSKNGNYLLNVPPKADGSLDKATEDILEGIGEWMDVNGDAIYSTRPWRLAEEGTWRFTRKGDILYAISLEEPTAEKSLIIKALSNENPERISSVKLLGSKYELKWQQTTEGLKIAVPKLLPCVNALSFQIEMFEK